MSQTADVARNSSETGLKIALNSKLYPKGLQTLGG